MRLYCDRCKGFYVPPISNHKCPAEVIVKLIDSDNLKQMPVTEHIQGLIEKSINSGEVVDACGDVLEYRDCVDGDGDICVDEDMYESLLTKLFTR